MRACGYAEFFNRRTGDISYVRPLSRVRYPQFHVYINGDPQTGMVVNLHMDAKQPTYESGHAHAGEYDSPVVAQEAARIRSIIEARA